MIINYLKIAWRNLLRHKSFSLINIMGLSGGIAACIIIFLYVHYELTHDRHNTKIERIVRVTTTLHTPESDMAFATSPFPLADALKRDYPEVASTVRLQPVPSIIKRDNELFKEPAFYLADQSIFSIFSLSFIEGPKANALQNPNSIVLTKTIAKKYFGNTPALGKTIFCNRQYVTVTAVIANPPANSDIKIDALLSTDFSKSTSWMGDDFSVFTFVLFNKQPDLKNFEQKLKQLATKYCQPELDEAGAKEYHVSFGTEALADVHYSKGKLADTPKGNKQFNYIFSLLAVFILVIALLNYINLSTARSTERAKEVGVRKVNGARPFQLIRQFLFESFSLISIAWIIAIGLVLATLPFFNKILQTQLALTWQGTALFMLSIFIITILLAGLYPAFVLSNFRPVEILKGKWRHSNSGVFLRKALTTAQFVITAALITGTIVIYSQVKYIDNKNLGFTRDQIVIINVSTDFAQASNILPFTQALNREPVIKELSAGSGVQQEAIPMASTIVESGGKKRELMFNYFFIDKQFLPLLRIPLAEGRNLSDSFSTDKNEAFLVNEALAKKMGWTTAIGQPLEGFGHKGKVVGVVKNFYYKSLHNVVEPLVLLYNTFPASTIMIKIREKDLSVVKKVWKAHFPDLPFEYSFMDEVFKAQYKKDRLTSNLFTYFTILAIFISCLGLYGLVSLMAVQRTKEIGIRKVLGASLNHLVSLLTRDFVKLIVLASLIALPVAGIAMNKWLSSYAYHISMEWWMFLLPVLLIIIIALAVIGQQVLKAALANPVAALRNE